jgi:hypothetical protein
LTFTAVSTIGSATAKTFTLTPHATGDFILLWVTSETAADFATAATSTNVNSGAGWTVLVPHVNLPNNAVTQTLFIGQATSTSGATVTVTTAGSPVLRIAWQEFSNTLGYAAVSLDNSGTVDLAATGTMPPVTPTRANDLYAGYVFDNGSGTAGSTSGFTYQLDPNTNQLAYRTSCANATQTPNIGDSNGTSGIGVMLYEAVTAFTPAAALSGSGSVGVSRTVTQPAAAALSGTSALTAGPAVSILPAAALIGLGALTAGPGVSMPGAGAANLDGEGTLTAGRSVTWQQAVPLSGSGTVSAQETGIIQQAVPLSGFGNLGVAAAAALQFSTGLFGAGFLSIPQVAGGLVNGVGGAATPQALPGSSQVAVAPPGSSNWQWLGTLGQVTALQYSYVCPGGCDQMTCTIMVPASYRTQLFNPGWKVRVVRGGHQVWDGKLDEPQPSAQGWTLTAVGTGNLGQNFTDYYSVDDVWPQDEPDEVINRAIGRGLPWLNSGLASSPYFSQFWFGQASDPGSSTVTDFLNLICTRGGLTWYVNSQPGGLYAGDDLNVFPLPTVANRLLVCTSPVARTLGGYVNSIVTRYLATADNATTGAVAAYNVVNALNQPSITAHGVTEAYLDLSNAGVLTSAAALAVGANILQVYESASWAGPFSASYGQLLNTGGQAIDPGVDQAGTRVRLILVDGGYGGEVVPGAVTFTVGSYTWDDFAQVATIGPYQALDQSLSGLLSMTGTVMTPLAAGG